MNRQEFIEKLRISLNGKVPGEKIAELTGYYEGYISDEIAGGKTEEEVKAFMQEADDAHAHLSISFDCKNHRDRGG